MATSEDIELAVDTRAVVLRRVPFADGGSQLWREIGRSSGCACQAMGSSNVDRTRTDPGRSTPTPIPVPAKPAGPDQHEPDNGDEQAGGLLAACSWGRLGMVVSSAPGRSEPRVLQ